MDVTLLYIDECPSWALAEGRLRRALDLLGYAETPITHVLVTSDEHARALDFRGCPTVLLDGVDPFSSIAPARAGLTCREYPGHSGPAGAPTLDQLVAAIGR